MTAKKRFLDRMAIEAEAAWDLSCENLGGDHHLTPLEEDALTELISALTFQRDRAVEHRRNRPSGAL